MDIDWLYSLSLLFFTLLLSAFFSGSEVAFFSLNKKKLKDSKEKRNIFLNYVLLLLDSPRRLLVTILLCNTVVNVAASILAVVIALEAADKYQLSKELVLTVQIILLTILILLIGEVTPKIIATKYPYKFALFVSIPLYWIGVIVYPVAKIVTDMIKLLTSKMKFDKSRTALLSSEIGELAELGAETGTFEEGEHELIYGLVNFKSVTAREVMTPRVDIFAIPVDASLQDAIDVITESGHSRLPLYEDNLDNIQGIIYAKDLLPYLLKKESGLNFDLKKISRRAIFTPESKLISDLMHEFQKNNTHMGIVVDEYGGTSGLISLEDILEEIVGEIRDEYDQEENEITPIAENSYLLLGKVSIDELNDLLGNNFSSENDDYDTVGGFIYNHSGTIPENGYSFEYKGYKFTVKEIENKRIGKVLVEKILEDTQTE